MRYEEMTVKQRREYGFIPLSPGVIQTLEWRYKNHREREEREMERDKTARLRLIEKRYKGRW